MNALSYFPIRALRPLLVFVALAPITSFSQVVFMDFGAGTLTSGWNNVTATGTMASSVSLTDFDTQTASGLSYQITASFTAWSSNSSSPSFTDYPSSAVLDFFHGNSTTASPKTSTIKFTGLDPAKSYTFSFVSTRKATDSLDRSTQFTTIGSDSNSVTVNAYNNATTVSIASIKSDALGVITLNIGKGATNTANYYYLNALQIEAVAIPEPSTFAALLGFGCLGLCLVRRKR